MTAVPFPLIFCLTSTKQELAEIQSGKSAANIRAEGQMEDWEIDLWWPSVLDIISRAIAVIFPQNGE